MLRKTVKIPDVSLTKYAPGHPVTESLLLAVKKGLRNGVQEKDNLQKSFDKKSKIFFAEMMFLGCTPLVQKSACIFI